MPRSSLRDHFLDHPGRANGDPNAIFGMGNTRDKIKAWCYECYQRRVQGIEDPEIVMKCEFDSSHTTEYSSRPPVWLDDAEDGSLPMSTRYCPTSADANISHRTYTMRPKQDTTKIYSVVVRGGRPCAAMSTAATPAKVCLFRTRTSTRTYLSVYLTSS